MNEIIALGDLRTIASAEETYQATAGNGQFGTSEQLVEQQLIAKDIFTKSGYQIAVTVSGDQFYAIATPREYGKSGKRSFYIDKSGVLRGDDHGGGPATIADKPIEE
jgi:hypothetical protein